MYQTKIKYISILLLLILIGSIFRIYNVNFDDFWYDEMVSFWISDPSINFINSLNRIFSSNLMVSYEIFLKFHHYIFGYDVYTSRYFSSIISIISIVLFYHLLKKNSSQEASLFGLFLLVINIYHIKYSLELRAYILTFLLTVILIYYIFDNKKLSQSLRIYDYIFIFLITLVLLFSHAFSLIIIFSILFFLFLNFMKYEADRKLVIKLGLVFVLSSALFLSIYLNNISHYPDWIEQVKPSFYTNYYFSKFFGSRSIGLIFLIIFIFLIINFRKKIIKDLNIYTFFLILFFSSYTLPLVFGYLIKPILVDRYILFVLVPLLAILSHFTLLIKNKIIKFFLIFLLLGLQIINLFDEYTLQQFYTEIYKSKPELRKIIKDIDASDTEIYSFYLEKNNFINYNLVRKNYLKKYVDKLGSNIIFYDYYKNQNDPKKFWLIYFKDITDQEFELPSSLKNYVLVKSNYYTRSEMHQLERKEN